MSRNARRALILLVAIVALGGFFARRTLSSPRHALRGLVSALRLRDQAEVERRMDIRAVSRTLADDWVAARMRDRADGGPVTAAVLDSLDAEIARTAEAIERDLRAALRDDSIGGGSPLRDLVEAARLGRSRLGTLTLQGSGEGERPAQLQLRYPHLDTLVTLNARLTRREGRWVLTGVQGLEEAGRRISDSEAARLLVINQAVHDTVAGLLRIDDPGLVVDSLGSPPGWITASLMVSNASRQPVSGLRLRVYPVRRPAAAVILELAPADTLMPGSSGRLTGRVEGGAVSAFLPVLRGRDDVAVAVTRGVVGRGRAARRYQAAERWEPRP